MTTATLGSCRLDLTLQPVSGKALPVHKGEVLRVTQVEGEQCVDFNCFNLHDYKEYMSVGHMRREGFHTRQGQYIWSNPPRYRPMMKVLHMPPTCVTDLQGARCSAVLFEVHFGIDDHPNCQDTLAEAIGEYGLTPDDTHDSFNMWMNTEIDHVGYYTTWNTGRAGDHVDLIALMDVLAVPAICGSGNLWATSNFSYKPIRIQVFAASPESAALAEEEWRAQCSLKTQRTLKDFRNQSILTEPELRPVPGYQPQFPNYPIEWKEIEVAFRSEDFRKIMLYRGTAGDTDEEVVRTLFFYWYLDNRNMHGLRWYNPAQAHA